MDPAPATLPIRLDALGDLVSIVIVAGQVGEMRHVGYMMVFLLSGGIGGGERDTRVFLS